MTRREELALSYYMKLVMKEVLTKKNTTSYVGLSKSTHSLTLLSGLEIVIKTLGYDMVRVNKNVLTFEGHRVISSSARVCKTKGIKFDLMIIENCPPENKLEHKLQVKNNSNIYFPEAS